MQTSAIEIRPANLTDLPTITAIYNHAVQHTTAIWNETTVDLANREQWFLHKQQRGFPIIIATDASNEVLGYATYAQWRDFDGYKYSVEHSVYVHPDQQGKGIGKQLLIALIDLARQNHQHVMIAGIEASNIASIRLHEKLGFQHVGTFKEVGTKFGKWLDLTFLSLQL